MSDVLQVLALSVVCGDELVAIWQVRRHHQVVCPDLGLVVGRAQ